jgi:hypothetical protein
MAAERKDQHPADAWTDIPDPITGAPPPRSTAMKPPTGTSPTRSQVRLQRAVLLGAAALWPFAVFYYYGGHWRGHGIDYVAVQFVIWATFLLLTAWLALSAGKRGVGRPVPWLRIAAVGVPLAFALLALFWLPPNGKPAFADLGPPAMLEGCFQIGLTVAVPMLLLSVFGLRRSFPAGASWRGAALGAACGLGGVVVLLLLCGSPFSGHIAVAHGLPLVVATLVGAIGGRRVARA